MDGCVGSVFVCWLFGVVFGVGGVGVVVDDVMWVVVWCCICVGVWCGMGCYGVVVWYGLDWFFLD